MDYSNSLPLVLLAAKKTAAAGGLLAGWPSWVKTVIAAGVIGVVMLLILFLALYIYSKLYQRARSDEALVRTGKGGVRAVAGGGMIRIPFLHEIRRVSLQQYLIPIDRTGDEALIATDGIKADVKGTMYVRVGDEDEDIKQAAKTFEQITEDSINEMIAGKVTDAMRAEAMKLTYKDLHVKKQEFAEQISVAVKEDLAKTGLVLDSMAIESIQQCKINPDPEHMPMDVLEAAGVRRVVEVVEEAKEATNKIRREKQIAIQAVDVHTRKQALALAQEREFAEADQVRQVKEYKSEQDTAAKQKVFKQDEAAEAARINKEEMVAKRTEAKTEAIAVRVAQREQAERVALEQAAQAVAEATIEKEKAVETATIAKQKGVEAANIEKEKAVETATVEKMKAVEAATIAKMKVVETADVDRERAVAEAKEAEAMARAKQATAEALQKKEEENIVTVAETEQANRAKQVAVIKAQEEKTKEILEAEAERDARAAKAEAQAKEAMFRAKAERERAQGQADATKMEAQGAADARMAEATGEAEAIKTMAQGHADNVTVRAEADATAATLQAQAQTELAGALLEEGKAKAEAARLMIVADNEVADKLLLKEVAVAAIENAPAAIAAFMEPASAIGEIKVLQLDGLGGANGEGGAMQNGLPNMVANTLAQAAGMTPIVQQLLGFAKEAGLTDKAKEVGSALLEEVKEAAASNGSIKTVATETDVKV
jgi:flotillin